MPLYVDVLFLLNFLVDWLLLMATDRLCGQPGRVLRAAVGALVGGIYGCACVIPGMMFLAGTAWRMCVLVGMGVISFGWNRDAIRRCVLFVLLSMALGGVAQGINVGFWTVGLSAVGILGMCFFGFRRKIGAEYVPVEMNGWDGSVHFVALRDTGNQLVDPLTGKRIMVVSPKVASRLTGMHREVFTDPAALPEKYPGIRLISFQTVGCRGGLLAVKRFENVKIGHWKGSCLVAFAPNELGKQYDALTGGTL